MLTTDTINQYLEDNALPPDEGYLLKDAGAGVFIAVWDLAIPEPTEGHLVAILVILALAKGWRDVKAKQDELLGVETKTMWRMARHQEQLLLAPQAQPLRDNPAKMMELLTYRQSVRDADETTYSTPQEALDALNALTEPT